MSNNAALYKCGLLGIRKNGSFFSLLGGIFFQLLAGKELESGFPLIYLWLFLYSNVLLSLSCLEKCLIKQICWARGGMQCLVRKLMSHLDMVECQICIKRD